MRSIYGFILLSTLLFTGLETTADRTFKSTYLSRFVSDITSEKLAQDNGNYCPPGGSQRDGCLDTQSHLLLASAESKPGLDQTRDRMPRGTGRRESIEFEQGSSRLSLKDNQGLGSGRFKLTNHDEDSDVIDSNNDEAHRASGRLEA